MTRLAVFDAPEAVCQGSAPQLWRALNDNSRNQNAMVACLRNLVRTSHSWEPYETGSCLWNSGPKPHSLECAGRCAADGRVF